MDRRLLAPLALLPILAGCAKEDDFDVSGGLNVVRSTCPAVAVPAYTGDVSLFSPEQSRDARALDVVASIDNLRKACDETGTVVHCYGHGGSGVTLAWGGADDVVALVRAAG